MWHDSRCQYPKKEKPFDFVEIVPLRVWRYNSQLRAKPSANHLKRIEWGLGNSVTSGKLYTKYKTWTSI